MQILLVMLLASVVILLLCLIKALNKLKIVLMENYILREISKLEDYHGENNMQ